MLSEGKTMEETRTEGENRTSVRRRTFLKGLGGVAAGVAVASKASSALANNGWSWTQDEIPNELQIDMYTKMLRSREWETAIKEAFLAGNDKLYGAFHMYIGEEAVAVGAVAALNDDDFIASTHRGHGHLIAKGGDLNKMSAEMFFRQTGYNKGFGGSMHLTDVSKGILGMNGILGPQYLIAAGAAKGIQVRGTKQVAVAFGGDGSTGQGWLWSGLRNARMYNLPAIYVIENNGYEISIPTEAVVPVKDIADYAMGLHVPSEVVDGMDVLAMYSVMKRAVARARAGEGPTFIEAKTDRFHDHSGLAGAKPGVLGAFGLPYRSDSEVRAWIAKDPIPRMRNFLIANGTLTEEQATKIDNDVKAAVTASLEFARQSPMPADDAALEHVYASGKVSASQFIGA
jgi:TPP-dependent pyruvate/acetoin dehydrogenase alpha subunit